MKKTAATIANEALLKVGAEAKVPKLKKPAKKVKGKKAPAPKKPPLPPLDPAVAYRQAAEAAQEGNVKLARACDILREGLQTLVIAERDNLTGLMVSAEELREIARATLDAFSRFSGQDWRRVRVVHTRAGTATPKGQRITDFSKNRGLDGGDYD